MTTRKPAQKPPVHLRVREGNIVGGTQLISMCGERVLETHRSRRRMSKSLKAVTCALCLVMVKPSHERILK